LKQRHVSFTLTAQRHVDGLDNLVVADKGCNAFKSSSLPAAEHLTHWTRRFVEGSDDYTQVADLAKRASWDRYAVRSLSVARAIYFRLPSDARLWLRGKDCVPPDAAIINVALSGSSGRSEADA
jgi:hypothetical protein